MAAPVIGPLTMTVVIHDDAADSLVREVLISAFCPACGERRGTPHLMLEYSASGLPCRVDRWENECRHIDTDEAIIFEVDCECASPGCVLLADGSAHPYCGPECAAAARTTDFVHCRNAALLGQLRAQREAMRGLRGQMATQLAGVRVELERTRHLLSARG